VLHLKLGEVATTDRWALVITNFEAEPVKDSFTGATSIHYSITYLLKNMGASPKLWDLGGLPIRLLDKDGYTLPSGGGITPANICVFIPPKMVIKDEAAGAVQGGDIPLGILEIPETIMGTKVTFDLTASVPPAPLSSEEEMHTIGDVVTFRNLQIEVLGASARELDLGFENTGADPVHLEWNEFFWSYFNLSSSDRYGQKIFRLVANPEGELCIVSDSDLPGSIASGDKVRGKIRIPSCRFLSGGNANRFLLFDAFGNAAVFSLTSQISEAPTPSVEVTKETAVPLTATPVPPTPTPKPPPAPVTIRLMHQFNDAESAKFAEIVAQFEKENPDIKLKLERNNDPNYYDVLVTAILGGAAPDIARVEPPKAAQYIGAGYATNLDPYISKDLQAQFFEGTLEPVLKDGSLYGLPQDVAVLVLFYRTDMFEEAGIAAPPKTWDELVEVAKKLTRAPDVYGLGLFGGWGAFEFYPWFWQAGGEMLEVREGKLVPAFNSEAGVEALQFWVDLIYKHKVMPEGVATYTEDDVKGGFIAKTVAMFTSGPWSVASLKQVSEIEGKWAIAPLPKGKEEASVLGGMHWIVLEQSKHKEEAARFLNYYLRDEIQKDWAKSLSLLPIKKSLYEDPFFKEDPLMQAFAAQLAVARSRPTIPQAGEIDGLFGEAFQAAIAVVKTPKEALDEAATKAADVLR